MHITNPKNVDILTVLALFGSLDSERLFELYREIMFKKSAVQTALKLVVDQEEVLQKLNKEPQNANTRTYLPELTQMAYVGFFLDSVYALTEKCAEVTKIFFKDKVKSGFHKQRDKFIMNSSINSEMTSLMIALDWYDMFIEVRSQHTHGGTSFLGFGYDKEPLTGSSQLFISVFGNKNHKILHEKKYNFDVRSVVKIKDGLWKFIDDWALILLRCLDKNQKILWDPNVPNTTLNDFLEDRKPHYINLQ